MPPPAPLSQGRLALKLLAALLLSLELPALLAHSSSEEHAQLPPPSLEILPSLLGAAASLLGAGIGGFSSIEPAAVPAAFLSPYAELAMLPPALKPLGTPRSAPAALLGFCHA